MIGLDGEKMSKSRGNLVFVSKLRATGVDPNAIRLALLAGHYRADRPGRRTCSRRGGAAGPRWRGGRSPGTTPARTRPIWSTCCATHLADDLDTPSALAAVDAWAQRAREGAGDDPGARRLVRDAVDALLGVAL